MNRQFKCIDCGHKFDSVNEETACPNCKSENITPIKRVKPIVGLVITLLGSIAIGFCGVLCCNKILENDRKVEISKKESIVETPTTINVEQPVAKKTKVSSVPQIIGEPEVILNGKQYTLKVYAQTQNNIDELKYELYVLGEENSRYSSTTSTINNIAPTTDGIYTLRVVNVATEEYIERQIPGFNIVEEKQQPIENYTKQQLEDIFNRGNEPANFRTKFAKGYTLEFFGLRDDETKPDRYSEIFNRMIGAWLSIDVIDVEYTELNYIKKIKIQVTQ